LLALCVVILASSLPVSAQFSINWFSMDGGGGTSSGGVFSVSGTLGQPDAGVAMTGGPYSLTGGFWAFQASETPGAPRLRIYQTATNTVVAAWPSPSTGWILQQNTNLPTADWAAPIEPIQDDGTERFIIINPPSGQRFYRLLKP
jgi:hypothetical protein